MNQKIFEASLAGLIHDVGKVVQRGLDDPRKKAPIEEKHQKGHAAWTTHFVQRTLPAKYRKIAYQAGYHHSPDKAPTENNRLAKLVCLADRLSAGERSQAEKGTYPKQMVSIFDQIQLSKNTEESEEHFLPLGPLRLSNDVLFPQKAWQPEEVKSGYQKAEKVLKKQFGQEESNPEVYLENGLEAMRRATFNIPSAYYYTKPDVSLYDHSRMTAALAACLTDFNTQKINQLLSAVTKAFVARKNDQKVDNEAKKQLEEPLLLLVGGDLSGVQDFIYSISSKRAAKTLRGRSFYLQLLTEAILRYLLRRLELPYTNIIYAGGGHFYFLAPYSVKEKLDDIQAEITEKIFDSHGTRLYLALGKTAVCGEDFQIGNFSRAWKRMHKDVNRAKNQRYRELKDEFYEQIFEIEEKGGNQNNTCSVCGEEREGIRKLGDSEEARICPLCNSFSEQIGKELPKADYVILGFKKDYTQGKETALDVLHSFGMEIAWGSEGKITNNAQWMTENNVSYAVIWAFDDYPEDSFPQLDEIPAIKKAQYTVNLIPEPRNEKEAKIINQNLPKTMREKDDEKARPGVPLTFSHLQHQANGIERLGVLRMDVDNLGDIFSKGLGDRVTLARLSTLSFQISLFFEGWLKKICEQKNYCEQTINLIYAVYAGGDDVFLIGPWDKIPGLAREISNQFSLYTGQNPDFHISGGMTFIHGKYPVYQAAEDAGKAEAKAKAEKGKNAFHFLGTTYSWPKYDIFEKYFHTLLEIAGEKGNLYPEIQKEGLNGPKALLQTLQNLAAEKEKRQSDDPRLKFGPWMWHGFYKLRRMKERHKKTPIASSIDALRESLHEDNYENLTMWGKAARWTQLRIRES